MKKKFVVLVSVLMILCSSVAFADDGDFKATIGLKGWYNYWDHTIDFPSGSKTWNNGSVFMIGPSVNLKMGPAFLGISYLKSTSNYSAPDWYYSDDTMEFERTDLDLTLGFMFTRHFGAFLGYKSIDAPMKYTRTSAGFDAVDVGTWKMKGPGIGLLANATMGSRAAFYGNIAFMKVKQEFDQNDALASAYGITAGTVDSFDMTGVSLELGFALAFTENLSSNIGFKYQTFSGTDESGYDETHSFYGPTLGLSFTF